MAADPPTGDATRRTRLAGERTQLAWWRTGLTALAVGVGIGRVVPELNDGSAAEWPYVVLGVGFAIYGLALIVYGSQRGRSIDTAVEAGGYRRLGAFAGTGLAVAGALLALATCALIAFS